MKNIILKRTGLVHVWKVMQGRGSKLFLDSKVRSIIRVFIMSATHVYVGT